VVALVSASNGATTANYAYGPFGELLAAYGVAAKLNEVLFSSKIYDWETGLYYYGHRYYNPSTGRWPSRDPMTESGFQVLRSNGEITETEKLLYMESGMMSLQRGDSKSFRTWLSDLAARESLGQWPYSISTGDQPDDAFQDSNGGTRLYEFCNNDANDNIDPLGLRIHWPHPPPIPYGLSCANIICGHIYLCGYVFQPTRWIPRHPILLEGCLAEQTLEALAGCAIANYPMFVAGCRGLGVCYSLYWN
jgi:RHS repeat-associated protein